MRVNTDKLAANVWETAAQLRADPAAGHVHPGVETQLIENVHARSDFVQYGKSFSFECDEAVERAGDGEAPSPLRYLLSGLAFCMQVWYAKGAALAGCHLEDLQIDVDTYMDMRGEHLIDDVPPHPQWMRIQARVASPSDAGTVLQMVDEANARCPVYSLISRAVPIYEHIWHNGDLIRNTFPNGLETGE